MRTREKSALRLLSFALALTLLVTPALATGRFPAVNTYAGFGDVSESAWYSSAVRQCYETGLMNGTGKGNFSPEGAITVAECAAIAARLRESFTGQAIPGVTPAPGESQLPPSTPDPVLPPEGGEPILPPGQEIPLPPVQSAAPTPAEEGLPDLPIIPPPGTIVVGQ